MSYEVVVVDYGVGNLYSVKRAFEYCNANVILTGDAELILNASKLVLPGVGSFADGMRGLIERNLDTVIRDYAETGKPMLGICLGMQMLASISYEFGEHSGLDIIAGKVVAIPDVKENGTPHKIPHIGWQELVKPNPGCEWNNTILKGIQSEESFYHVHSFTLIPDDDSFRLADSYYDGRKFSSVVRKGNVYGCQFHPEKSGRSGLRVIQNFLEIE